MDKSDIYISKKYLQNILIELKEIVDQDLIYMNVDGIIIASTDSSRIGDVHYGGKKVLKTGKDLLIESDQEYIGAKKGINMPVKLNDTIIGVIGITGNSEEVIRYVKIIKRLTEIFIKDGYAKDIENSEIEKDRMIMDSLVYSESDLDENLIIRYENLFGIKNNIPRIIISATIAANETKRYRNKDKVFRLFRATLKNTDVISSLSGNNIVMILENKTRDQCDELIKKLKDTVKQNINFNLRFGIGDKQTEISKLKISYQKAMEALKWSSLVSKEEITYYEDFDIEMLLTNIYPHSMREYVDKVLYSLDSSECSEYSKMLNIYEKHNGSIIRVSEELFIHKNTLQYKINKLSEKTGYDMRKTRDFMVLRIAFTLKKLGI